MKKIGKFLIVLIIILILYLLVFFGIRMLLGSKLNIKIIDSYENEILSYDENKMPFTLQSDDEEQVITVNGQLYTGQRFYKPGKYKVEITKGVAYKRINVNINDIEKNAENEYYIFLTSETLQTLFASLEIANKKEINGFMWTKKSSTIDSESMVENSKFLVISENIGNIDEKTIEEKLIPEVSEYIKQVLQKDENAYFHLYLDEYRFQLEFELLGKLGLSDNRYDVTIYSDGTLSYIDHYETATAVYVREYKIREENAYDTFIKEKNNYETFIDKVRCGEVQTKGQIESYLVDYGESNYNFDYLLLSTLRENVRYLLQYPEMITFKDEKVKKEMENANLEKIVAVDEFKKLDEESQKIFFKNIKLSKEELDENYFEDQNGNYLVITGTKPFYGKIGQENFERLIKKVHEIYSNDYIILYKPHPSALPDEKQEKFLSDLNIKVLPGRIPMEAICFIYPNLKLGGFDSSLYMSADEGKTEFFFVESKEDLVAPLNQLYDDLFSDAEFYY